MLEERYELAREYVSHLDEAHTRLLEALRSLGYTPGSIEPNPDAVSFPTDSKIELDANTIGCHADFWHRLHDCYTNEDVLSVLFATQPLYGSMKMFRLRQEEMRIVFGLNRPISAPVGCECPLCQGAPDDAIADSDELSVDSQVRDLPEFPSEITGKSMMEFLRGLHSWLQEEYENLFPAGVPKSERYLLPRPGDRYSIEDFVHVRWCVGVMIAIAAAHSQMREQSSRAGVDWDTLQWQISRLSALDRLRSCYLSLLKPPDSYNMAVQLNAQKLHSLTADDFRRLGEG